MNTLATSLTTILDEPLASVREREANTLERLLRDHKNRVVIFGCGALGRSAICKLRQLGVTPVSMCDNNQLLWGSKIDDVPVMSVAQAASAFGQDSLFIVAVWNPYHWFGETAAALRARDVCTVVPFHSIYWRFPSDFLQVYLLNALPNNVYRARGEVLAAEELWADELSRNIYRANICWRALGDTDAMPGRPIENTYFPPDIFRCKPQERIVDCGAYDGDTIKQIVERCGANLDAVYALEGDSLSFERLQSFVASLPFEIRGRIHLIHGAVGGERAVVRFTSDGGTGSHIDAGEGADVQCYPIDSLDIPAPVSMIKMDVEGAEYDSLLGAKNTILRDCPLLAICVYHTQSDIWRIPLLIRSIYPHYQFFLRAYEGDGFQTVVYAVPPQRMLTPCDDSNAAETRKLGSA